MLPLTELAEGLGCRYPEAKSDGDEIEVDGGPMLSKMCWGAMFGFTVDCKPGLSIREIEVGLGIRAKSPPRS